MQLSPHFALRELTVTSTNIANHPDSESDMRALYQLAAYLECVRGLLGNQPIIITSAYRNKAVNRAVGGVSNSHHCQGYAADFRHKSLTAREVCKRIANSSIPFDQLILERDDTLTHISFAPTMRRECLRQPGGPGTPFFNLTF